MSVMRYGCASRAPAGCAKGWRASVFLYGDGAGRAPVDGLAQAVAELLGGILVEHVEVAVVAHFEDLGQDAHAHGVAGTLVEVHDDLHKDLLVRAGLAPPSISATPFASGFVGADHPHGKELRAPTVGLAERFAGIGHLVLARQSP